MDEVNCEMKPSNNWALRAFLGSKDISNSKISLVHLIICIVKYGMKSDFFEGWPLSNSEISITHY